MGLVVEDFFIPAAADLRPKTNLLNADEIDEAVVTDGGVVLDDILIEDDDGGSTKRIVVGDGLDAGCVFFAIFGNTSRPLLIRGSPQQEEFPKESSSRHFGRIILLRFGSWWERFPNCYYKGHVLRY